MELEELQQAWNDLSREVEKQKQLNHKIIMDMTQEKYRRKFDTITRYETTGAVVCLAAAMYVLFNFEKLDSFYYQACGIFAILFLTVLPFLVLQALRKIRTIDLINQTYQETLKVYLKAKDRLLLLQKIGVGGSIIFFFITLILTDKIKNDENLFDDTGIWVIIIPVFVALIFFARWGYRMYLRITGSAEKLVEELDD